MLFKEDNKIRTFRNGTSQCPAPKQKLLDVQESRKMEPIIRRKIIQQKQIQKTEIMELEDKQIKIVIIKIFKDLKENIMKRRDKWKP